MIIHLGIKCNRKSVRIVMIFQFVCAKNRNVEKNLERIEKTIRLHKMGGIERLGDSSFSLEQKIYK